MSGGEVEGARLLWLARRELLEQILPELSGETRYRARLIANAMKIAAQELEIGPALAAETAQQLAAFAAALGGPAGPEPAPAPSGPDAQEAIRRALREGSLDGDPKLYELLCRLSEKRRQAVD